MIEVHVIDVPEFRPMVETQRENPEVSISGPVNGYWTVSAPTSLTFSRKAMKMKPAVWYGIFTGGLNGEIADWGRETVTVVGTNKPL